MAWDKFKENFKESFKEAGEKSAAVAEDKKEEKQELKERLAKMDKEGTAYCPKCYSTDLSGNKRGFKLTTGIIGMNKVIITCMKCGNKFKPKKR